MRILGDGMKEKVLFYKEENCPLCDEAHELLLVLQLIHDFEIEERMITSKDEWFLKYQFKIPVVVYKDEEIFGDGLTYERLESLLSNE